MCLSVYVCVFVCMCDGPMLACLAQSQSKLLDLS